MPCRRLGEQLFLTDGGHGDDADLSRRDRAAAFRGLRRCCATAEGRAALGATTRPTWRSPGATAAGWCSRRRPGGRTRTGARRSAIRAAALDAVERRGGRLRRARSATPRRRRRAPMVLSGAIGPRGDGYRPGEPDDRGGGRGLSRAAGRVFAAAGADLVTRHHHDLRRGGDRHRPGGAGGRGCRRWSRSRSRPTAACAPGMALGEAIEACDAATGRLSGLLHGELRASDATSATGWPAATGVERIGGIRANASKMSHDELDEAPELDAGDPARAGRATIAR